MSATLFKEICSCFNKLCLLTFIFSSSELTITFSKNSSIGFFKSTNEFKAVIKFFSFKALIIPGLSLVIALKS